LLENFKEAEGKGLFGVPLGKSFQKFNDNVPKRPFKAVWPTFDSWPKAM
jgi:hypothetical protein